MLPGHMMVRVDAGFVEPEDFQNIVETLQKRASGHATAPVTALKRSGWCSGFVHAVSTNSTNCTDVHEPVFYQRFSVHLPRSVVGAVHPPHIPRSPKRLAVFIWCVPGSLHPHACAGSSWPAPSHFSPSRQLAASPFNFRGQIQS